VFQESAARTPADFSPQNPTDQGFSIGIFDGKTAKIALTMATRRV
jgi:hypothetical protein